MVHCTLAGKSLGPEHRRLLDQLADLDAAYPGGLVQYITNARALLKDSQEGAPLDVNICSAGADYPGQCDRTPECLLHLTLAC